LVNRLQEPLFALPPQTALGRRTLEIEPRTVATSVLAVRDLLYNYPHLTAFIVSSPATIGRNIYLSPCPHSLSTLFGWDSGASILCIHDSLSVNLHNPVISEMLSIVLYYGKFHEKSYLA
jgi:hypothetical protein